MPREPLHSYRCPDDVFLRAKAKAERQGESLSRVIRRALEEYAKPSCTPKRHPFRRADDQQPERGRRTA